MKKFQFTDVDGRIKEAEAYEVSDFVYESSPNSPVILGPDGLLDSSVIPGGLGQGTLELVQGIPYSEIFTLGSLETSSKKVFLNKVPATPVTLIPDGGMPQRNNVDFIYNSSDNSISWGGLGLDGFMDFGDIIEISYSYAATSKVEYVTLTPQQFTAKKIFLTNMPISRVSLSVEGGLAQRNSIDFEYLEGDNSISWAGLGLDGFLDVGDLLEISYFHE